MNVGTHRENRQDDFTTSLLQAPTRRLKSPPRPTGLSAGAPAGGTRLGEGLAEPTPSPQRGHTVARRLPATPTVTTRRRANTGPIRRLHRGGRGLFPGPRRCAALHSHAGGDTAGRRPRPDSPHHSAPLRRTGGVSAQISHSSFHHNTTKTITVNTATDSACPRQGTRRRSLADACSDDVPLRKGKGLRLTASERATEHRAGPR